MRRGEVWSYEPVIPRPEISIKRLIVSSDAINEADIPWASAYISLIGIQQRLGAADRTTLGHRCQR